MHSIRYRDAILIVYMLLKKGHIDQLLSGRTPEQQTTPNVAWTYLVMSISCLTQAVTITKVHRCRM